MRTFVSVVDESFKLKVNATDKSLHNFRPCMRSISVNACRNSFAAFQLILDSNGHTCINLDDSPWFSEFTNTWNIYIRHSGELQPIMNHVGLMLGDDNILYADVLKSEPVVDVEPDVPASVFIRFELPASLPAGDYSGSFGIYMNTLFGEETEIDRVTYTIHVSEVTLPAIPDRVFNLDLWQHNCNIARKAETPVWSDRHFEIIEKYIKTLADLGQRTMTVVASEAPWSGQRCFLDRETTSNLFEYSMIRVFCDENHVYHYDYSVLDRYIDLCSRYGINREIEVFGLINNWISVNDGYCNFTETADAIRIRYRMPDGSYRFMKKTADIEDYIAALCRHFTELGLIDRVRIVADEPADHESFSKTMALLKRVAPAFRYKAAIMHKTFFDEFGEDISDFCVTMTSVAGDIAEWKSIFENNKTHNFTYYVCCFPQHPNTLLSSSLLEARYIAVLADYFGFSGFLRWNYTVWPKDPRKDIRLSMWPAGDTNFVYPAGDMSPLLSLRYMALRRGMEDYELIAMLRRSGKGEVADSIVKRIVSNTDFGGFYDGDKNKIGFDEMSTADYGVYEEIRKTAYCALTELSTHENR